MTVTLSLNESVEPGEFTSNPDDEFVKPEAVSQETLRTLASDHRGPHLNFDSTSGWCRFRHNLKCGPARARPGSAWSKGLKDQSLSPAEASGISSLRPAQGRAASAGLGATVTGVASPGSDFCAARDTALRTWIAHRTLEVSESNHCHGPGPLFG
jgi:hypothetical protein